MADDAAPPQPKGRATTTITQARAVARAGAAARTVLTLPAGTHVRAEAGDRAVESLRAGDQLTDALGGAASVAEVRHRSGSPEAWMVRVRAGALADRLPGRDLLLPTGQTIRVAEAPDDRPASPCAADLVNGASILHEAAEPRDWVELRLAEPGWPLAEGVPLGGLAPPPRPALTPAAQIIAAAATSFALAGSGAHEGLRRHLADRAAATGHGTTFDPDLHIDLAGRGERPRVSGRVCRVDLPGRLLEVRLRSRATVPARLLDSPDIRRLGVAVGAILADGQPVPLDHWSLREGWHGAESGWRWTDGDARLLLPAGTRVLEIAIAFVLPRYPLEPADGAAGPA